MNQIQIQIPDQHLWLKFKKMLNNEFLEAVDMQRHVALITRIDSLQLLALLTVAQLAVETPVGALGIPVGVNRKVVGMPGNATGRLQAHKALPSQRWAAVGLQHADHQLPEEGEERLLLAWGKCHSSFCSAKFIASS